MRTLDRQKSASSEGSRASIFVHLSVFSFAMRLIRQSVESLSAYVPGEQPADREIVKLNTNENPYPPSPRVASALASLDPADLRLYPDPVCRELRDAIAALHGCRPAQVFVGNGSDEILALCTKAFVEDDGSIGYFDPSYSLYPVLSDIRCAGKRPVALDEEFRWQMPDGYASSLFFMTNPNAPTSMLHARATVRAFCERFPGVVLIDEAYVDFSSADCMDLALQLPNVLVLRTVSKSYSLAGLRVGYVVGSEILMDAFYKLKDSYNVDRIAQRLALAAVQDQPAMRANVARILATRERLAGALRGLGFRVYPSETNFLWVRPAGCSARELFEQLRARKIFVRYFSGPRTGDFVRITIGTDAEVDRLIEATGQIAKKGQGR
jgi:histidinol-phosphate aminotransferase